jgi:hypothetical protein
LKNSFSLHSPFKNFLSTVAPVGIFCAERPDTSPALAATQERLNHRGHRVRREHIASRSHGCRVCVKTRPFPPWGRGWAAMASSSAGAGRVRGFSSLRRFSGLPYPIHQWTASRPPTEWRRGRTPDRLPHPVKFSHRLCRRRSHHIGPDGPFRPARPFRQAAGGRAVARPLRLPSRARPPARLHPRILAYPAALVKRQKVQAAGQFAVVAASLSVN